MKRLVRIPHGEYIVDVKSRPAWIAIKFGFLMRNVPISDMPIKAKDAKGKKSISEADLLLIGATHPGNSKRMRELRHLLGLSPA